MEQNNIILYVPINKVLRRINQKWDIIIYILYIHSTNGSIIIVIQRAAGCNSSLPQRLQSCSSVSARALYIIIRKRAKEAASVRDRRDIGIVFSPFFFLLLSRVNYYGLGQCSSGSFFCFECGFYITSYYTYIILRGPI